ncbi:penicillin-binding transpeptidase domain-containing protein [Luteolibacter marinus]|uniref:penicillin-binding transpeptidase domain-containing protein n=1 Tax=Luteolibacter marinus TaxID=2776705 RepID=UPI001866161B
MRRIIAQLLSGALVTSVSLAQELASIPKTNEPAPSANDASIFTRRDARAITLAIPAPRGMILDRAGQPLAQNRMAWQLGLQYQQFEKADRQFVIDWGRQRIEKAKALVDGVSEPTDDELWEHYKDRRWLPLLISSHLGAEQKAKIESSLSSGLILHPVYQRFYPEGSLAAHIVGYTGSVGKLPTGPINFNEPLWEESEGRAGLEYLYNRELTGEPGMKKLLYDEHGRKFPEEQPKRPRPGGNVVTTLNLDWQRHAEKVLAKQARRGAFVLIDVNTGEVLVMASRPSFDLNLFIPGISTKAYQELKEDPATPLYGRAFQSKYPPGSCFKPIVALTALNDGLLTEDTLIDCPGAITLGNHTFHNHNKKAAGAINVTRALASSNNIWFGKVGIKLGAATYLNTARRFGFGEKTGLDLIGETDGNIPTNEWMLTVHKRRFMDGDAFNMAIGQGAVEVSPLQVAQAMAGIANGGVLPKLHLIHQVQDPYGRVIKQAIPERRNWLGVDPHAIEVVREGMREVVESGTGRSAGLSFTEICGKTGTAQWKISPKTNLAWFAGFLPFEEPRFAFAAVYEGRPNESVGGGRNAAPIVRSFFEPLEDEIKEIIAPAPKALEIIEESDLAEGDTEPAEGVLRAQEVELLDLDGDEAPTEEIPRALPVEPDDLMEEE